MEIKSGYKTSEFWIALVGPIVAMLALFGVVNPEQADTLAQAAIQGVVALFALGAAVYPIVEYIKSRARVKEAAALVAAPADTIYLERPE